MLLPQSAQWLRDGPCDRRLFARSIASFTVASICSCTAPSPAQPVAIPVLSDYRISFLNNYHWVRLQVTAGRPSYRDVPPGAMVPWPPEPGPRPAGCGAPAQFLLTARDGHQTAPRREAARTTSDQGPESPGG